MAQEQDVLARELENGDQCLVTGIHKSLEILGAKLRVTLNTSKNLMMAKYFQIPGLSEVQQGLRDLNGVLRDSNPDVDLPEEILTEPQAKPSPAPTVNPETGELGHGSPERLDVGLENNVRLLSHTFDALITTIQKLLAGDNSPLKNEIVLGLRTWKGAVLRPLTIEGLGVPEAKYDAENQ